MMFPKSEIHNPKNSWNSFELDKCCSNPWTEPQWTWSKFLDTNKEGAAWHVWGRRPAPTMELQEDHQTYHQLTRLFRACATFFHQGQLPASRSSVNKSCWYLSSTFCLFCINWSFCIPALFANSIKQKNKQFTGVLKNVSLWTRVLANAAHAQIQKRATSHMKWNAASINVSVTAWAGSLFSWI